MPRNVVPVEKIARNVGPHATVPRDVSIGSAFLVSAVRDLVERIAIAYGPVMLVPQQNADVNVAAIWIRAAFQVLS